MYYSLNGASNGVISQGSTGAGTSAPGVSTMPFGHFWNSTGAANTYGALVNPVYNQSASTVGTANAQWQATNSGTILSIEMFEAGPANGVHTVQFIINNVTLPAITIGTGGNGAFFKALVGQAFNIGDTINAQVANSVAGNTQVQATLTLQLNP